MAYEVQVVSDNVNNARTESRAVTFLIRDGQTVKAAEVMLPKEQDARQYGEDNAAALFKAGSEPPAKVSPAALFEALKARQGEAYFLKVIFAALRQLKLGGTLSNMVSQGRDALGEEDTRFAEWQAFEAVYKAGSAEDRLTLDAMATWVIINLLVGQDRK
jgi:hypothetical protein